ncbi:hypothetical protein EDD21DRAFT_368140 [Dissophora ornata]|nr:hypothetical protein EDD21DRAFT_368140 [Dissophora ornata]
MPFPSTSPDLMASAMGGSLLTSSSGASVPFSSPSISHISPSSSVASSKTKKDAASVAGNGTVRIFYSLKENPNAIISYSDLIRQEQRRQRSAQLPPAKNDGNATTPSTLAAGATPNPTVSSSSSQSTSTPLKNSKVTGTATGNKDSGAAGQPTATNMDIDPPEGEEALVDGDSEAEDDDEEDDDDEDNEDGTEAEDEDDDDDPDEEEDEDDDPESGRREPKDFLEALTAKYAGLEEGNEGEDEDEDEDDDDKVRQCILPSWLNCSLKRRTFMDTRPRSICWATNFPGQLNESGGWPKDIGM